MVEELDADGGFGVVEADGEEFVFGVKDDGEVACLGVAFDAGDAVFVEPWVAATEVGLGRAFNSNSNTFDFLRKGMFGGHFRLIILLLSYAFSHHCFCPRNICKFGSRL